MKIEIKVERTQTGYSAYSLKYPVYTVGVSLEELKTNILEALNLFFAKEGRAITHNDLKITMDLPQFFAFYKVINAKALSERIGINQSLLAQYISGNKKPSPTQTSRVGSAGAAKAVSNERLYSTAPGYYAHLIFA